ncbi:MAG: hypothetical protein JO187_10520, partial [Acidobacteria bacterium]|nr:hypothetical protein [Acidobacteriota bacterium]
MRDKLLVGGLAVVIVAVLLGIWFTSDTESGPGKPSKASAQTTSPVNTEPLQTAVALRSSASTAEEQELANKAVRLGDDAVDLAFSVALREAFSHPPPQTPEITELT